MFNFTQVGDMRICMHANERMEEMDDVGRENNQLAWDRRPCCTYTHCTPPRLCRWWLQIFASGAACPS